MHGRGQGEIDPLMNQCSGAWPSAATKERAAARDQSWPRLIHLSSRLSSLDGDDGDDGDKWAGRRFFAGRVFFRRTS